MPFEKERTLGEIYDELRSTMTPSEFFRWPPNAFALTSVILGESGAYRLSVDPPTNPWPPKNWDKGSELGGAEWRRWAMSGAAPSFLKKWITVFLNRRNIKVSRLHEKQNWVLCRAILAIHAMADEACVGGGIPGYFPNSDLPFYARLRANLDWRHTMSHIPITRIKVLPKVRTPSVGISLRSLSHNLSIDKSEVEVKWYMRSHTSMLESTEERKLNLLILPFPKTIPPNYFEETEGPIANMKKDRFGCFSYRPKEPFNLRLAEATIKRAKDKVDKIHGIILPECAISEKESSRFSRILFKENIPFFIAGVWGPSSNFARLGIRNKLTHNYFFTDQDKHHRWLLTKSQITNYHLGSVLHPSRSYWEDIAIRRRTINFISPSDWLTMCHLICEDLARHDPVTQVVRSVGPNLVVALLLDGPQFEQRWPGKYASVLADDPGSSVLTITSLGMAHRSLPKGRSRSNVIGLWKDSTGDTQEISLDGDKDGVILSLSAIERSPGSLSADGREDRKATFDMFLAGIECV